MRTSTLNIIENTLLLYYFRSYSANLLREILKMLDVIYSYSLGETCCGRPQSFPKRRPYGDAFRTSPGPQF